MSVEIFFEKRVIALSEILYHLFLLIKFFSKKLLDKIKFEILKGFDCRKTVAK